MMENVGPRDLVPEIWAKMLLANQMAEFLNQIYLMKLPDLMHGDTNSRKFKVDLKPLGWGLSNMGVANLVSGL